MYLLLTIGAVTTVYPFLLMLGASVTSSAESGQSFTPVPRYLYDDNVLFAKWVEDRYQGDTETISAQYHRSVEKTATEVSLPSLLEARKHAKAVSVWNETVAALPPNDRDAAFRGYATHPSPLRLRYEKHLRDRFGNDIERLNKAYTTQFSRFEQVFVPVERSTSRTWRFENGQKERDYAAWKESLPPSFRVPVCAGVIWAKFLQEDVYRGNMTAFRSVWGTGASTARFNTLPLPETAPRKPMARCDWEQFVRERIPLRYVSVIPTREATTAWEAFITRRPARFAFPVDRAAIEALSEKNWRAWGEFVATTAPLEAIQLRETPDAKYARAIGKPDALPPIYESDAASVRAHVSELRGEYLTRNYSIILDYLLLHGNALWVTVVFCGLSVMTALVVNPICAYALSRFNLPTGYGILVFLLATMAFPAEVAMIPNFLLLRDLGLLNTMAALVLPGVVNGFSIFLLKGFFDGLPAELYEAAELDGASEMTKLFRVTLPMSTAILSVIALNAFLAAYGAFMFALIVCQDPKMWTIMVWLYQLQATAPPYLVMAGLVVAAVPTLLVFLFAQNVILRGILVPIEK